MESVGLSEDEMRTFIAHESSELHRIYLKLFELSKKDTINKIINATPAELPVLQGQLKVLNHNAIYMQIVRALLSQKDQKPFGKVIPITR